MSHQVQRIFTLYKALSRSPSQAKTVNELAINQNVIDAYDLKGHSPPPKADKFAET